MKVLIGDIGNTITKVCLVDTKTFKLKKIVYLNSSKIKFSEYLKKNFNKIIKNNNINKVALFSSVALNQEVILKNFLKKSYKIKLKEIKENGIFKVVKLNVKNKKQVGSDRIANAVGAFKKYKSNCIILDFGTATTFDVVTKKGTYNGGVIAPGVNLSIKSLVSSADQIPHFSLDKPKKSIGKNTVEALHSGFYWGYVGLINNIISKIKNEDKKKYKIIFTGGYADLFKTSISGPFKIDKNITIQGIIEIFKHNMKNLDK
jgi:type III pantothenate kinase